MANEVIQNTFLNTYRDDYSDSAGYHRILFNNGRAVQARELTQMQTAIQREITRMGDNFFKEGAIVQSGGFTSTKSKFVKLNTTTNTLPVDGNGALVNLEGVTLTSSNGVKAIVTRVVEEEGSDPATLYVIYSDGSAGGFAPGNTLSGTVSIDSVNTPFTLTVQTTNTTANPATGVGLFCTCEEGAYYITGRFVFASKQTIVASKYTDVVNDQLVFKVTESIVTADSDNSLYDNSGQLPNTSAPGADRYKIDLTLSVLSQLDSADNYTKAAALLNGVLTDINRPSNEENYNTIRDFIATRTSEESGDYIVKPFKIRFADNSVDTSKLDVTVDPGVAYVDGYRAENKIPKTITVDKPRTTTTINNEVTAFTLGNYVLVDGSSNAGIPNIQDLSQINLYNATGGTGTVIGTARVRAMDEDNSGNFRVHLFQISMNSGTNFRSVRSLGTGTSDFMNLVLEAGQAVLKDSSNNSLIFPVPKQRPQNLTDVALTVQRRFTDTNTGGSSTTFTLSAAGETIANVNDWIVCAPDGSIITGATVTGAGGNTATVSNLGGATSIEVLGYVNKSQGVVRSKSLQTDFVDTIIPGDWDSDGNGTIFANLAKADIYNFQSVTKGTVTGTSVRSRFTLDNGQRDNYYGLGRLVLKSGQSVPTDNVVVKYDYFTHGAGDFFAVNSYSTIDYEDIPSHTLVDGTVAPLRRALDFRPVVNSSGNFGSGAIINELPQPSDTIQADISYYNGRRDKAVISTDGYITFISGEESLDPEFPLTPTGMLELYRVTLNPYTLDYKDVVAKQIEHKHYTMADIGLLEKRLNALAEATSLSMLELDTATIAVLDSDGNNRAKSGFFVDNFVNHAFSDISDPSYSAQLDPVEKYIRPTSFTSGINLTYDSDNPTNSNVVKKGDNIYLAYDHEVIIDQDLASRTENVLPFWNQRFEGHISLSPASDNWIEKDYIPDAIVNQTVLDTSGANLWNDHEWNWGGTPIEDLQVGSVTNRLTLSRKSTSSVSTSAWGGVNGTGGTITSQNTTTNTTTGQNQIVGESTVNEIVGDRVLQTASIPFMRSRKVFFKGEGFRPNVEVYPFFENIDVSDWCRSETFVRTSDAAETVGNVQNAALGHPEGSSALIADANGVVEGSFFIPSTSNFRFNTGTKEFLLIDVTDPLADSADATSFGRQLFTSAGVLETRQRDVLSTRILEVSSSTRTTSSTVSTTIATTSNPPASPPPVQRAADFSCFVAGTLVTMADGTKKNIENVVIGEQLLGQDGAINTVIAYDHPMLNGRDLIAFNGGKPFMTPEHPLWTKEGWKSWSAEMTQTQKPEIAHLMVNGSFKVGDEVLMDDGTWFLIESIDVHKGEPEQQVFNFILDGNHTYFADGFLAHNRDVGGSDDPLAQSFKIVTQNGFFATKVDVYFAEKDPGNSPVWGQIRAMDNGYPAEEIIGGSTVFKYPSEITTSEDGSVATTFEFPEPVYLAPGKEYCFVLISSVSTYKVFISRVGDFVLGTTDKKIAKQPFLGSLFKSQNDRTWTASQWEDMKFKLYVAKFDNGSGTVELTNTDVPSRLLAEDPLSIDSGDNIITVLHPNHGFDSGDTVRLTGAVGFAGINASAINDSDHPIIHFDADGYQIQLAVNSTSSEIGGGSNIIATQNIPMDVVNLNIATLKPNQTGILSSVKTTSASSIAGDETGYQLSSTYEPIQLGKNKYFNSHRQIANAANETAFLSGNKSFKLKLDLSTNDSRVSPVIDLQRATAIAIANKIDRPAASDAVGFNVPISFVEETNPKGGSASSKHITKPITLAQDAVGLKVILSANKPAAASWDVYYRVISGDSNISDQAWTLIDITDEGYPTGGLISDEDKQVFREYEYLIGGKGGTLNAFNQFQIKIVMTSSSQAKIPTFKDLRAIAMAV